MKYYFSMLNRFKNISLYILIIIIAISLISFAVFTKRNENHNINIVFNTDKNYTEYTKVAILSAIDSKNKNSIYNINILCVDLPEEKIKEFNTFVKDSPNVNIKTIPLKMDTLKGIGEYQVTNPITRTDLFKFFMADIFPQLDKILYIDSDTLIVGDLSKLYNTDISKYYIGAVKGYKYAEIATEDDNNLINFERRYTYNCGVILFNLKKFREDNIKEKLIEAKNKDMVRELVTQKSFNDVIPLDSIKQLSPIYNLFGTLGYNDFKLYNFRKIYKPYCNFIFSYNGMVDSAVIIHYAGEIKPWNHSDLIFAEDWRDYAKAINVKYRKD